MPVYPGDPIPELKQVADIGKEGYTDFQITTAMHVGTHMDGPLHMIENGKYLFEMPVEKFFGQGHIIDARGLTVVGAEVLDNHNINKGDILLVLTGFGKKYREDNYYESYPEINENFAHRAVELGVSIVGMDTPSPDRPPFKTHKILLGKEILIIENLTNLEKLLTIPDFEVFALPAKLQTEAAPVRVIARYTN